MLCLAVSFISMCVCLCRCVMSDITQAYDLFSVGLMFPGAAAETQLDLRCNVTRRPDGSTLYRVSEPRGSNRCTRDWMGQNVSPSPSVLTGFIRERLLYFNDMSSASAAPNMLTDQSVTGNSQQLHQLVFFLLCEKGVVITVKPPQGVLVY